MQNDLHLLERFMGGQTDKLNKLKTKPRTVTRYDSFDESIGEYGDFVTYIDYEKLEEENERLRTFIKYCWTKSDETTRTLELELKKLAKL